MERLVAMISKGRIALFLLFETVGFWVLASSFSQYVWNGSSRNSGRGFGRGFEPGDLVFTELDRSLVAIGGCLLAIGVAFLVEGKAKN
jgi:hypothetical protein